MITPSKMSVLDIKNSKLLNKEPVQKTDKGFGEQLIEKQKKLKKKDDDVAPQDSAQQARDRHPERSEASSARSARRSSVIDAQQNAQQKSQQKIANTNMIAEAPHEAILAQGMMSSTDEVAMLTQQATAGKIALEGMEMVKPQALSPDMLAQLNVEKSLTDVTNLLSGNADLGAPTIETGLQDLLSQNSGEQTPDMMSLDFAADVMNPAVTAQKENAQAAFGTMLKTQETLANQTAETTKQMNVDNIVSQARAILRDGGGEMQVVLNPPELGTIDLKVAVENGQVNVEIMTKDHQVKKMFDDSVFEIRGALEGQNLKIDTFKVGVSENFDMSQQFSQAQQEMSEREFAREFMGQFRDERNGFRTAGFVDGLNGPSTDKKSPEGLQPSSTQPRAVFNGSGRLNVVV